ncbi:hypothetical protein [Gracilibacillus alcaliphilus]|uniref:hypothetical protein n=1 Tax=Gracilibacillus alcaliphilus TaxID=1401441 RepID=UPI00195C751A|nr:hypothetical protein [Gracilibacillus alcaliphilus]MBM7678824.1 hypothetical protein [Gracilibacillus alcaliphilus]
MQIIAKQPYVKVIRQIRALEQKDTEEQRYLYLYKDKIVSKHREFPIEKVLDVTYRLTGEKGMLYLHTLQGVYAYIITSSPESFIAAFKAHTESTIYHD